MRYPIQRIIAMLICTAITAGTFAGCASDPVETEEVPETSAETAEETPAETKPASSLPDRSFDGRTFTVYTRQSIYPQFHSYEIKSEETNGEILNDAIFDRTTAVEERYDMIISEQRFETPGAAAIQMVRANDNSVDFTVPNLSDVVGSITEGYFFDLNQGEYFEFDKPWWHKSINDSCSVGGKMFMSMNDALLLYKQQTYCLFFNKGIASNHNLRDYYAAVLDGSWTWDIMYEDMKVVSGDTDGDGNMTQLDNYGYVCQYGQLLASVIGGDVQFCTKDENDFPVLNLTAEHHINVLDKIFSIFTDTSSSLLANDYSISETSGNSFWDIPTDIFYAGRALFIGGVVRYAPGIYGTEIDFGILPVPKYDINQDNYYAFSEIGNSTAFLVPVTANLSDSSFIIEAMSAESYETLVPKYYESMVKSKYSPDPQASEVLDIMFAHHRFDTSLLYSLTTVSSIYDAILSSKNNIFSSRAAAVQKQSQAKLNKWINAIKEMEQ